MTIGARTAAWSGEKLPYDAEVEYIQSSKGQYIDTGIVPNGHDIVECWFTFIGGTGRVFSARTSSYRVKAFEFLNNNATAAVFVYFNSDGAGYAHEVATDAHVKMDGTTGQMWFNDALAETYTPTSADCEATMALFASHGPTWYDEYGAYKMSHITLKRGDSYLLDMIPVRVGDVGYMYDRVRKQLFGNLGTGAFTIGPDAS